MCGLRATVVLYTLLGLLISAWCQGISHGSGGTAATLEQYRARDRYAHKVHDRASDDGMAGLQTCWRGNDDEQGGFQCQDDCPNPQPADEVVDGG